MKALRRSNTSSPSSTSPSSSWIHLRSLLIITSSPAPARGSLKSPWSRRKRKHALSHRQWNSLFSPDGKLRDGGVKFLKKARSGGIDPSIRAEVWPFLLGVYDLNSTEDERNSIKRKKRKEFEILRRRCRRLLIHRDKVAGLKGVGEVSNKGSPSFNQDPESSLGPEDFNARPSLNIEEESGDEDLPKFDKTPDRSACNVEEGSNYEDRPVYDKTPDTNASNAEEGSGDEGRAQAVYDKTLGSSSCNLEEGTGGFTRIDASAEDTESSDSESSIEDEHERLLVPSIMEGVVEPDPKCSKVASLKGDLPNRTAEDFATWQRIIRLDAVRANAEWVIYYPDQSAISEDKANRSAAAVGLRDYDHLEPCMIYHAARLVAVLEAYTVYDPEIGYCQGMSDLLSPILAVMEEDHEAFWCFVGFMRKARHNFRLDEAGIRRQLGIVAKIIRSKDLHLYRHLEKLQAEDCFFVYRMVVVLFRRELSFEHTVCLWEVMWADQAAIRAGIGKLTWGRIRLRAPPTDDLLLYAIAACVLQRRKLIIEKYSSMDEIMRECNDMAGHLDVWRLLDDAHDLVVRLHDKV